jgi:muramoyltetrapeptide carboxypeptidase
MVDRADQQVIKPPRVNAGETVVYISPASPINYKYNETLYKNHVLDSMKLLGLNVKFGINTFDVYDGYLAGSDEERAADVNDMFTQTKARMIIANRGGWGCNRILQLVDFNNVKNNPKPIMGYSDLTALLNSISFKTGLVTFHGPMGLDNWNNSNSQFVRRVIMNGEQVEYKTDASDLTTISGGKTRGKLIGGNLSVFASMIGSEYLWDYFGDKILFLEEIGEEPYRIDRMMMQLELSGVLKTIKGFVWGRCTNCQASNPDHSQSWQSVIMEKMKKYPATPSFIGALTGHIDEQWTLPIGVQVEMDARQGTIKMLESAVL